MNAIGETGAKLEREGFSMRLFGLLVVAVLTAVLFAHPATANAASVVATINGGGTAIMDPTSPLQGTTAFAIHATLYSDGTAKGARRLC